ncbi:unnamed protein product [Rotaria sp. Silwood1]|nr:unnamed protein product [Rotaria sp. Silwood1]CAF1333760.1 unnamed protein product [Rotaria sp. Silwood1]CAF3562816.1 unnamed protein product [Rotaria sp. Silwood1]CAF3602151.1 unnamed protein product [Rotaria sp. Silwood1]CAF4582738.1 unnamed protein product [Rotaria sp. Silwood1]
MSMEAQFYEARRRQSFIERRQSFQNLNEITKPSQQPEYATLHIPVRLSHHDNKHGRCTCIPMRRTKLVTSDQSLYKRDRDIYPRPPPLTTRIKRHVQHAKLHHRFSSTEYLQQW